MSTFQFNHPRRLPKNVAGPFYTLGSKTEKVGTVSERPYGAAIAYGVVLRIGSAQVYFWHLMKRPDLFYRRLTRK